MSAISWEQAADSGCIELLLSDNRGIYMPHDFADNFAWDGISEEDKEILKNPDHEHYWEAWENVLHSASYADKDGHVWSLYQDGDLFAIREDIEIDWDSV